MFRTLAALFTTSGILALSACGGDSAAQPNSGPAPLAAPPISSEGPDPKLVRNSEAVDAALRPMRDYIEAGGTGFAQSAVDNAQKTAEIQWKRPVPAEIKELESVTTQGVAITVVEVPFSAADVAEAAKQIARAANRGDLPRPEEIRADDGFVGLQIGFLSNLFERSATAAKDQQFERLVKMPVEFVKVQPISGRPGRAPVQE